MRPQGLPTGSAAQGPESGPGARPLESRSLRKPDTRRTAEPGEGTPLPPAPSRPRSRHPGPACPEGQRQHPPPCEPDLPAPCHHPARGAARGPSVRSRPPQPPARQRRSKPRRRPCKGRCRAASAVRRRSGGAARPVHCERCGPGHADAEPVRSSRARTRPRELGRSVLPPMHATPETSGGISGSTRCQPRRVSAEEAPRPGGRDRASGAAATGIRGTRPRTRH